GNQSCTPSPCPSPLLSYGVWRNATSFQRTGIPPFGFTGTCLNSSTLLASGSNCSIGCSPGYSLVGANYSCLLGQLSGNQSCSPLPCNLPLAVLPAFSTPGTCNTTSLQLRHATNCSLACASRYTLAGSPYRCSLGNVTGAQSCLGCVPGFSYHNLSAG